MSNFSLLLKVAPFDFAGIFGNFFSRWYYYVVLVIFLALVVLFAIKKKGSRNSLTDTQKIVYVAIFSALSFVANYFTIKVSDALQISLVATVGFVSGYLLGAGWGFTAAFVGDLICGIVAPFGTYNPIIGIGTGLWGFIPGVLFSIKWGNKYLKTVLSFVMGFVLNSFAINTFGLSVMYSLSFASLMALLPIKLLTVAINAGFSFALLVLLPKILPKNKFYL